MPTAILQSKITSLRDKLAQEHVDPVTLHDEVQEAVTLLESVHETVPSDLREAVEELQAEILEEFYDNLPV
ncbi:MAG: hypothetical protein KDA50_02410 [Rhodobacteraceae bacterium]|nr:hypothetical protein [Paracoccaceae bacterium]